jgi:carbonic anhydrase
LAGDPTNPVRFNDDATADELREENMRHPAVFVDSGVWLRMRIWMERLIEPRLYPFCKTPWVGDNMCQHCLYAAANDSHIGRRSILKMATAVAMGLVATSHMSAAHAKAPPKPENVLAPDAALDRLMKGNARYVDGTTRRHDFKNEREALSTGQNPFAAVLSCADSRIAPEYCFDTARGDVFVCRVAGNFASEDIIASLEYAVQVLNAPLIVVLGHGACGAVDATIKSIKDGTTLPGHLPALVNAIKPAVEAVQNEPGDMLANATRRNVMLNVEKLKTSAPILNSFVNDKKIRVIGGIYELKSGRVDFLI